MLFQAISPHRGELSILAGSRPATGGQFLIRLAGAPELRDYHRLRQASFVVEQGMFRGTDRDDLDDDPRTVVLGAVAADGTVLGGVRLAPACSPDIGWWTGSRLVADPAARAAGVGPALVRAACAHAESVGALRFEATVQRRYAPMFVGLGWTDEGGCVVAGRPHVVMRWPLDPVQRVAAATKSFLGEVLDPLRRVPDGLGPKGFVGDDGVPVPGGDVVAACDAIIPSMVERDPEWAGWCSVLVNVNDLSAMGATPTGLLDAVGAPNRSLLTRIVRGVANASQAWRVPVLGGHTQLGVPASLAVTALGRTADPVPAAGGATGDALRLTVDLCGRWRPGYHGRQWDSTSGRCPDDLARMGSYVAAARPRAAKDVSMAGIAGTAGMLAEAGGVGAEIDVAAVPRPPDADMGSWMTCFPGFGMLTAGAVGAVPLPDGVASRVCGRLTAQPGVRLRWPDGVVTTALPAGVTGLGRA
ncbi:MSMEG_0567/sll0787 family protein [Mycolicibacterium austroafricanum]|uniref:MSMEG_0567/sll0787 family protein n=1 Tax=Mycolicibacterium austroafricanum TaxID=39687 RepID=UPI001CA37D91|nr:MSMEG_0567/sll0787 family protein [Mycolicibacterium austroafricanum]QZT63261.1 AIR synthase [Mycolicibacterium austroafricanum]